MTSLENKIKEALTEESMKHYDVYKVYVNDENQVDPDDWDNYLITKIRAETYSKALKIVRDTCELHFRTPYSLGSNDES